MSGTRIIDGIYVHSTAGSLTAQQYRRIKPTTPVVYPLTPVQQPIVQVQYPANHIISLRHRGILLAKSYSSFFPIEGYPISSLGMMAGICGMLTNLIDPENVDRQGELSYAFNRTGATLQWRYFNTEQEVEALEADPRVISFLNKFQPTAARLFFGSRDQQILCAGIILLTLGKDVNPDNYDGWIKNRLRGFQGALGILPDKCCWTEAQCPPQESLTDCYRFLSASFDLRRLIFLICVSGAKGSDRLGAVFREVLIFLQGVEMGHIIMIDRYLFSKYPELLRIRVLRDSMLAMNRAWEFLASLDPGERFFAKILYDKNTTAPLNRQNFSLLATAAIAAAQFETPSMQYYKGGNVIGTSGTLASLVRQYLSVRTNIAMHSVILSPFAYLTPEEKQRFMDQLKDQEAGMALVGDQFTVSVPGDQVIPAPPRAAAT